jgi:hypothetical protein
MQTIMIQLNIGSKDYDYKKAKEIHDVIQHLFPDDEHICVQPCSVGSVQGTSWCRTDVFCDLDIPEELYDIVTDDELSEIALDLTEALLYDWTTHMDIVRDEVIGSKLALLKANYSIWQTQELIDVYNQSADREIYMTLEPHDLEGYYKYAYLKYQDNHELISGEWSDRDENILNGNGVVSIRVMDLFKSKDGE